MSKIRVVSDVHGKIDQYIQLVTEPGVDYSIQLGDMGFYYTPLAEINWRNNVFLPGNHDNYDILYSNEKPKHCLGDFGPMSLAASDNTLFYVRGAPSIDALARVREQILTGVKGWWAEEELDFSIWDAVKISYAKAKPRIMLTHDVPRCIVRYITKPYIMRKLGWKDVEPFRTPILLQELFEIHQPEIWLFGHYHVDYDAVVDGTRFICKPELGYTDWDENWNLIGES